VHRDQDVADLLPDVPDLADATITATLPAERLAEAFARAGW